MFAALAFGVAAFFAVLHIPLVSFPPWLHYDAKDVLIALSGFILGPVYAVGVSLAAALLELTISSTGPVGALMNFLASAVFSCSAALVYRYRRSLGGAVTGLAAAIVLTTAFMLGWNYLVTPLYMGVTRQDVKALLLPGFLPFNLIKTSINAGVTLLVYKPVINALRFTKLVGESKRRPDASLDARVGVCPDVSPDARAGSSSGARRAVRTGVRSSVISISVGALLVLLGVAAALWLTRAG